MDTVRSYVLVTPVLLAVVATVGLAFSQAVIGAATSVAQATPITLDQTQSGEMDDSDNTSITTHTGSAAIRRSISNAGPNAPGFTEKDVRDFVSTFTSTGLGKIGLESGVAQIESIQFVTMGTFRSRPSQPLAQDLKFSDDKLLCYVEYSGNFVVYGPGGSPPIYFKHAAQVYDAHTGNFLAQTAYDRK